MLPTWAIQLIFVVSLIGGAYWYFTSTQAKLEKKTERITQLEAARAVDQSTIKSMERAIKFNAAEYEKLLKQLQESDDYKEELIKIFGEHDLERLSIAKPGLIERRINEGTSKAFDDLERITNPDGM